MFSKMCLETFDTFWHLSTEYHLISFSLNVLYIVFTVCKTGFPSIYLFIYLFISLKQERDPFWEPDDAEVLIGSAHVYLQSLAYKVCLLAFISK